MRRDWKLKPISRLRLDCKLHEKVTILNESHDGFNICPLANALENLVGFGLGAIL